MLYGDVSTDGLGPYKHKIANSILDRYIQRMNKEWMERKEQTIKEQVNHIVINTHRARN
jgi:hypothetical protein